MRPLTFTEEELLNDDPRKWIELESSAQRKEKDFHLLLLLAVAVIVVTCTLQALTQTLNNNAAPILIVILIMCLALLWENTDPDVKWNSQRMHEIVSTDAFTELFKLYQHDRSFQDVAKMRQLWLEAHQHADLVTPKSSFKIEMPMTVLRTYQSI